MKIYLFFLLLILFSGCSGGDSFSVNNESLQSFSDPLALPDGDEELSCYEKERLIISYSDNKSPLEIAEKINAEALKTFSIGDKKYIKVKLQENSSIISSIKTLDSVPGVLYAEPVYTYRFDMIPDDMYYNYQYAPQKCSAQRGWDISTGSEDVIIAILDSGVNGLHEEFAGRMVRGFDALTGNMLEPYSNSDEMGHGTHVAGIACSTGNNGKGIAGVAWKCKIMPVRLAKGNEDIPNDIVARAIVWAADHGAGVLNMSFSDRSGYSQSLADAINYAMEKNVVLVSSMGNNYRTMVRYPAACQGIIAIGAIDGKNHLALFATTGNHISLCAPGVDIYSTDKKGGYVYMSGTSMSTPFVAGLCGLILSVHKNATPEDVKSQMEFSATDIAPAGWDKETGWGNVNVEKSLGPMRENKYARVKVSLKTSGGEPVINTTVLLYNNDNAVSSVRTDNNGVASFYYVSKGNNYISTAFDKEAGVTRYSNYFDVSGDVDVTINNFQ